MAESAHQIERQITAQRSDLSRNLNELESKAKSLTDWRSYFEKNPMTLIGVAFGGGILMASILSGRPGSRSAGASDASGKSADDSNDPPSRQTQEVFETWDNIKSAVIGVAATRFKEFVGEIVPGFNEQLRQAESKETS